MPRKIPKIPSIEAPRFNDLPSMQTSILQLKEAVELLSGQRGGGVFPTYDDASRVQEQIKDLQKDSKWDVIYNQEFSGVPAFIVGGLAEYRNLRGQLYLRQDTGAASWPYIRYLDVNGAIVTTATNYLSEGMYNVESVNPQNVAGWTNVALDRSAIALSLQNNLSVGNSYGCYNMFEILGLNRAISTVFKTDLTYYNGSNIVKGSMMSREVAVAARSGLIIGIFSGGGNISGHLYLEGLKG